MTERKYPIGIQNFGEVRNGGYAYADKTALMYKMISEGKYYFLSRPRRFGKSLLLSTIEAFFEGKKDLFEGLAVADIEKDWGEYPILHLDLNTEKYDTPEALANKLLSALRYWEQSFDVENPNQPSLAIRFEEIIRNIFIKTEKQLVILVDEYDKPLLQAIGKEDLQSDYRGTLKAFYGALKSCDKYIKFAFLTGVTKFGKVSIFSDLNNLEDISLLPQYADICGITEKELHLHFDTGVRELAEQNGLTLQECYNRLKLDFDGYHFCLNTVGLYNPFSLLNTLKNKTFRDYWFETGTPTFLVYQLQKTNYKLENMTTEDITMDTLNSIDVMDENPLPLLYQSGYLTIKDYDERFGAYTLGFPNREVEEGFIKYLVPYYSPRNKEKSPAFIRNFVRDVESGNAEGFMQRLQNFFDTGDYQIAGDKELYFQNTLYVFFKLLGLYVQVEKHTANGRMDIVIQTSDYVYIMELKVDKSAEEALAQIEQKKYDAPFRQDDRTLYKIGVSFSAENRNIQEWKIDGPSVSE